MPTTKTTAKVSPFVMQKVKSSSLTHIAHHGDTLRVTFHSGQSYDYPATLGQFAELQGAKSIGSHFHAQFGKVKRKLVA